MNTKILAGVIIVIVIIGGLVYFMSRGSSATPADSNTQTAATSTDQVQGQDVTVGTGTAATPGSQVSVLYVGYLGTISTSTIFDSSSAHGNQPLSFTLGQQGLIAGFQIGVNGMKVGGERLLSIPASLGYGASPVHQNPNDPTSPIIIPANSTLIFDVKLVDVKPGSTTPATH
jgi:FKBP-type peptidyl-prolyl cis-trans isomerase